MYHVTHGLSNALVLPHVLRFNLPDARDMYAELATVVGLPASATDFLDALEGMCAGSGIERRLRDVGIAEGALGQLADAAMEQTRLLVNNPREVTRADAAAIYQAAW
jgi:alcohol dehydrogenase